MNPRDQDADWLELSGLPSELNDHVRAGAWPVFKTIVDLDCRRNRIPDAVEMPLGELAERCGLGWEKLASILTALNKKRYLACFIPDNPDEPGLFQIRTPIKTPRSPEEVAKLAKDPHLHDPALFRYARKPEPEDANMEKVQRVVDLYLNTLSQRMNSFIVEQIEILSRRFPYEAIEKAVHRAARHDIRSIGWVAKELIRDASGGSKIKKTDSPPSHEPTR